MSKPARVDFEQLERAERDLARDDAASLTCAKSRTRRSRRLAIRGVPRERDASSCAPASSIATFNRRAERRDDLGQFGVIVKVEMEMLAEAVAQRRAEQARSRGRADQRERIHRQLHRARAHPLAHHDVKLEVLHRGVEALLDRALQAMNLVDEQHVALFEVVDDRGKIGGALDRGAGGDVDVDARARAR